MFEEIYNASMLDISSDEESVLKMFQKQIENNNDSDSSEDSDHYNDIFLGN